MEYSAGLTDREAEYIHLFKDRLESWTNSKEVDKFNTVLKDHDIFNNTWIFRAVLNTNCIPNSLDDTQNEF